MQKNFVFMASGLWLDGRKLAAAGKHAEAIHYFELGLLIAPGDHNLVPALEASRKALASVAP